jgi:hypothetical protein
MQQLYDCIVKLNMAYIGFLMITHQFSHHHPGYICIMKHVYASSVYHSMLGGLHVIISDMSLNVKRCSKPLQ